MAVHVKGLEIPLHHPKAGKGLAVQYGTANRGGCHIHPVEAVDVEGVGFDYQLEEFGVPPPDKIDKEKEEGKGAIVKVLQDFGVLFDAAVICKFTLYAGLRLEHLAKLLTYATGWEYSKEDLLTVGERINNLQRLFNVREGIRRKDDELPKILIESSQIERFDVMLDEYYAARGWNSEGLPKISKIRELRLGEYVNFLGREVKLEE